MKEVSWGDTKCVEGEKNSGRRCLKMGHFSKRVPFCRFHGASSSFRGESDGRDRRFAVFSRQVQRLLERHAEMHQAQVGWSLPGLGSVDARKTRISMNPEQTAPAGRWFFLYKPVGFRCF